MKFETNYSRARTIRGRELIQGRGSRCANYSRAHTNRGRELFGLLGYMNSSLVAIFIFSPGNIDSVVLLYCTNEIMDWETERRLAIS